MRSLQKFTQGSLYPLCFLTSALLLFLGYHYETEVTVFFAVVLFVVWDALFVLDSQSYTGRDATFTIQQVVQARSYISYFIPFYGIMFGILLSDAGKLKYFSEILVKTSISPAFLLMPFVVAIIVMLLFPLQVSTDPEGKELTSSIKWLFVCNFFGQKLALFLFAHSFLRIAKQAFSL